MKYIFSYTLFAFGILAIRLFSKYFFSTGLNFHNIYPLFDITMKRIRRISPFYDHGGECKIIVLTANAINGMREQLTGIGFDDYLGKPINFTQLESIFRKFIPAEKIVYEPDEEKE